MPSSILSRFKRSPSESSNNTADDHVYSPNRSATRRSVSPFKPNPDLAPASPVSPTARLSNSGQTNGSSFVEEFGEGGGNRPRGQTLPALGTPKLVLTEDGASSPVSFGSSPHSERSAARPEIRKRPSQERVGLGIDTVSEADQEVDDDIRTPRVDTSPARSLSPTMATPADVVSISSAPPASGLRGGRDRSNSTASNELRHVKSGSAFGTKPNGASLKPPDSNKSKKNRRLSTSSKHGIAAALAKGGIALAHGHANLPNGEPILGSNMTTKSAPSSRRGSKRNPYLKSNHRPEGGDVGSDAALDFDDEDEDDEEDEDSDFEGLLPVTGFAVASNRRNVEFHSMFPAVDEGDYLIEDYGCALSKDILVQGRLYVSENHVCFHANIFGWVTDIVLPFTEIKTIEKKMTALVIPNAIGISTANKHYTFATFISRDTTFDVLMNIWRLCNPDAVMSATSVDRPRSRPASFHGEGMRAGGVDTAALATGKGHAKTECACGKEGKHLTETALDTMFPSTPEKTWNLMFNSGWLKDFMSDNQKLRDIESSDWKPSEETKHLSRSTSYIKPLNGSIGPKQTKCHIVDEQIHCDYDDYIVMLTTTKTPDVPSGGVFSVKTRTCLTWAGGGSTRVLVTTQVEWTGKSWVKGIIDKSAIEGQKQYHDDLEKGMRAHMKEHSTEFFIAGAENDQATNASGEADGEKPTAAEEYAAETRRKRQSQDYSALQGALDSVVSGFKAIFTGVETAVESISDLLNLGDEGSKVVILGMVVVLLVLSNVYTYVAYKPTSTELRKLRRMGLGAGGGGRDDLSEAVRLLMQNAHGVEYGSTPRDEANELIRILDEVEKRTARLRGALKSSIAASDAGSAHADLD